MWTLVSGAAVAVVSGVMIVISDIYLSGHGLPGLTREAITWPAAGVHLSIGDIILISAALLAAALAWWTCDPTA
ncbi:MAG: hypothetical protein ACRD96_01235 [Bryobacteraceae bacterium]